jgi:hypothetical protein
MLYAWNASGADGIVVSKKTGTTSFESSGTMQQLVHILR